MINKTLTQSAPAEPASKRFVFLLMPEFSMMAFTAAIEPLRAANRTLGVSLYAWQIATIDGEPVAASNGVMVQPDCALALDGEIDTMMVCAGLNPENYVSHALKVMLRKFARKNVAMGGVCTGSVILASAGLLDGYRCTIHWEDLDSFVENFPKLAITGRLYEVDRDRFTCSGGIAPLDMMEHFIALDAGRELAASVADIMIHHFSREGDVPQRLPLLERTGVWHPKLLRALALMEEAIETPLRLDSIAQGAELSSRQLERLFHKHFKKTPSRYYLDLRLERSRRLLLHTAMPIMQVALATGFSSAAHFTKCYREVHGRTPGSERRVPMD